MAEPTDESMHALNTALRSAIEIARGALYLIYVIEYDALYGTTEEGFQRWLDEREWNEEEEEEE